MLTINQILLVLDKELDNSTAIKRAMQLYHEQNANLIITTYVYNHACEEGSLADLDMRHQMQEMLLEQTQQWAEDLMQEYRIPDDTPLHVAWCAHAYQAVDQINTDETYELVIKAAAKHHSLVDRVLQHQDWNLLRFCPSPVLLVKQKHAWESKQILAAVDSTSTDQAHTIVNEHIFEFAEILNADKTYTTHMVNSYPIMSLALASLPDTPIPEDLQQYVIDQHQTACDGLAHQFNIADDAIHVREGEPENVIAQTAADFEADLVIVGAIPKEGIGSVLLGSTVEHVVDMTQADVLAIKPQDGVLPEVD